MSQDQDLMAALDQVDLSKVETSFPILKAGPCSMQITGCEVKKDDKADAKPYVEIKYVTAQEWATTPLDGTPSKPINPGFPITQRIYFGNYEDKKTGETKQYGITQIAQFRESVFGKAQDGVKFNPAEMIGQSTIVKLKFDPAPKNSKTGETYGPQTVVDGWVKKK